MLSGGAEAGHASKLDTLPAAMDLKGFGVLGDGWLRIDESCHQAKMTWIPDRNIGFTFFSQEDGKVEETFRALEQLNAEAVALGGASAKLDAYMSRMKLLQNEAMHDGYGLNLSSEIDFRQFIRSRPNIRKGNLVLMDNGNLRAIWKDGQGSRLGFQFLGGRMVQYVIFKRRTHRQPISRVTGRDSLEGLERQIDAFELYSLLYE